jgi:hypothetical protein
LKQTPDKTWNDLMLWYALALATRVHADTEPYLKAIAATADDEELQVLEFYRQLQSGKPQSATGALNGMSLRTRGQAYAVASIIEGDATPANWRSGAKRLLFASERPYLD